MQKTLELKAQARTETNTRRARAFRAQGRVPAVLYGGVKEGKANSEVVHITIDAEEFDMLLKKHGLLIDMALDGKKKEVCRVKELQRDALQEFVMHVDFERIDLHTPIEAEVAVSYKGVPKGFSQGGQLRIESYKVIVKALPLEIPEDLVIKIDDLELNQVLRLKDIVGMLPKGVTFVEDPEHALCAVRPPVEEKEPEPAVAGAEGAAVEPEVIGLQSKKEEGEEGAEGAAPAAPEKKEKKKE
ncbi:MAG: 50S ribosomal protein L25 [Planctomycetota bacterium]